MKRIRKRTAKYRFFLYGLLVGFAFGFWFYAIAKGESAMKRVGEGSYIHRGYAIRRDKGSWKVYEKWEGARLILGRFLSLEAASRYINEREKLKTSSGGISPRSPT